MFKFIYDMSGFNRCLTVDLPVAKTAKIEKGQIVKISAGKAVCGSTGAFAGVANETHTGEYDTFNPRNDKDLINVIISPNAIYATDCPALEFAVTASDTKSATFPGSANYDENDVVGGELIMLSKSASSGNTDGVGSVRKITAYVKASKTLTLSDGGKISAGDKYAFAPPAGFKKLAADSNCSTVKLSDAAGDFTVIGADAENAQIHVVCTNNQFI